MLVMSLTKNLLGPSIFGNFGSQSLLLQAGRLETGSQAFVRKLSFDWRSLNLRIVALCLEFELESDMII